MPSCQATHPVSLARQHGAALLLLVVLLGVGALALFVAGLNRAQMRQERDRLSNAALAQAKAALIGWSAASGTPGQLPCPEDVALIGGANEGQALSSCTLPAVGRLPWRTLKLNDLRDGYGEKLWYAISRGFRTSPINTDTPAQLTVDGRAGSAVAIVISPGSVVNGQVRPPPGSSSPPDISQYLELSNSDGDDAYVTGGPAGFFNDRLLQVTHKDLFDVVEKRVMRTVIAELNRYFSDHAFFPRPARFGDSGCMGGASTTSGCASAATGDQGRIPANPVIPWYSCSMLRGAIGTGTCKNWFQQNRWRELVYYAVAPACTDGTAGCSGTGYLAAGTVTGVRALVILPGTAIAAAPFAASRDAAQSRPSTNEADYLDSIENTDRNDQFDAVGFAQTASCNDRAFVVAP